jgi:hypothetical protein
MSKETTTLVATVMFRLMCDCGGQMVPTGITLLTDPLQYPHECDACGKVETISNKKYPYVGYKEAL